MYLKKVEIHGFKSFADKIEIEFETGVTGIVGPNGSGKSNISDAVRWVLGEQSAKTLRGSKMEDIIFAGTTQRKPLGMAEVSLTLDNSENKLPIAYTEVTVTRRVYRSGESEYYINKSLCRLKDIREMFMDTGVGIDGYSIIGQGRIDDILSNKSEDRRLIFEEAAGIVKYKNRKEEAEKKLENTNQNLTRVGDIIKELESRIEPLEDQSHRAKQYKIYKDELKNLEINAYVRELEELKLKIETMKEQEKVISEQLQNYLGNKKEIEGQYKQLKNEIEALDQSIQQLQNSIFDTIHLAEKKDGEHSLSHERLNNIDENTQRIYKEIDETKNGIASLKKQIEELQLQLEEINSLVQETYCCLNVKENSYNDIMHLLSHQEAEMEKSKESIIDTLNTIASKKSEMNSLITLNMNIVKRQRQLEEDKIKISERQNSLKEELENIKAQLERSRGEFIEYQENRNLLIDKTQKFQQDLNQNKYNQDRLKQEIQEKRTREKLLKEMQSEYEGFNKSVKNALIHTRRDSGLGKGIYGVVAELIEVPKGYEVALEVALGSSMQNIICQSSIDANRVIEYLKKHNLGRITFLPIDTIRPAYISSTQVDRIRNYQGVIGLASDVIQVSDKYKEVFHYLLGRTILVDKIENGIRLAEQMDYKLKIVSLDGDIINPGGSITGGSYSSKTTNLLSRKREIGDLERSLQLLQQQCEANGKTLTQQEEDLQKFHYQLKIADGQIKEKEISLINEQNTCNQLVREIQTYQDNIKRIDEEWCQLDVDRVETQTTVDEKVKEIQELEITQKDYQEKVSFNKYSYEAEKTQKEKLSGELTELKIKIASLEQKRQNIKVNILSLQENIAELENIQLHKNKELENLNTNKQSIVHLLEQLKIELKDMDILRKQYEYNMSQLKSKRIEIFQIYEALEHQFEKMSQTILDLQDSSHKIEIRLARLDTQQEAHNNKLWEDYEITYAEALQYKNENIDIQDAIRKIKQLKESIKNLGNVNLNAISECEEVKERYKFLTEQKEDLIHAKDSLNRVIKEMESTMRTQFIQYFTVIKENFDQVFTKLFGGGRAELRLEDDNDVLKSGIEIIAQPPGKKLQNLSLLSGGERALTAIALLFAILMVKPTPFCILDEIEAALDDANVYRYAEFLKEFSEKTQFIVVTHRKGTMESVDALYGVTMQEQGISKLVSVKLTEKAS